MYSDTFPTTVFGLIGDPSLSASPSPAAASRSVFHSLVWMSSRFMPPPSDQSIPTTLAESVTLIVEIAVRDLAGEKARRKGGDEGDSFRGLENLTVNL